MIPARPGNALKAVSATMAAMIIVTTIISPAPASAPSTVSR